MLTEPTVGLSGKRYFRVQLALLLVGIAGIRLSHEIAASDAVARLGSTTLWTAALVMVALAAVARSTTVIVLAAFSDAYRVFRFRHLLACSALLGAAAGVVGSLIVHGPFDRLLAHGRITAYDLADLGSLFAVVVFAAGTAVASVGTWDAFREERNWHRSLPSHGHRST